MKNIFKFVCLIFFALTLWAVKAEELKSGTFEFGNGKKGYWILPDDFQKGGDYKFMLFCHGRGAAAGSAGNVGTPAFKKFRELANQKGYVIAVPPLLSSWYNKQGEKDTEAMLDFLAEKLELNLDRIYLCGTSMGGLSVLTFAGRNSERIIAVCDIFGVADMVAFATTKGGERYKENIRIHYGGYYEELPEFYRSRSGINYASILKDIPLMIIHGEKDSLVPIQQSENLHQAIKDLGGTQIELIKVPTSGHQNEIIIGLEEKVFEFFNKATQKK